MDFGHEYHVKLQKKKKKKKKKQDFWRTPSLNTGFRNATWQKNDLRFDIPCKALQHLIMVNRFLFVQHKTK